jgi:signal transduction histidine kinase
MVWLFLTVLVPTSVALPVALSAAVGNVVPSSLPPKSDVSRLTQQPKALIMVMLWSALCAAAVLIVAASDVGLSTAVLVIVLTVAAAGLSSIVVSWVSAVLAARENQLSELMRVVDRRRMESTAVFASLTTIVTRMADAPSLRDSAAIAACATGLARIQRGADPIHARRIIEWTESVVSAPGVLPPLSLIGRLEEVVHPWRALAEISVQCEVDNATPEQIERIVAVVDEAVRNACRHGQASSIQILIAEEAESNVRVEIDDDGLGLSGEMAGVGFERFAAVGSGGVEVRSRAPDPGTRVVVLITPEVASSQPP